MRSKTCYRSPPIQGKEEPHGQNIFAIHAKSQRHLIAICRPLKILIPKEYINETKSHESNPCIHFLQEDTRVVI